jgi:hypothetical protein
MTYIRTEGSNFHHSKICEHRDILNTLIASSNIRGSNSWQITTTEPRLMFSLSFQSMKFIDLVVQVMFAVLGVNMIYFD